MLSNLNNIFPTSVGVIHFIGIGGIGMSGIAEILHNLGYAVQGSDLSESYVTDRLKRLGINVILGHARDNVENAAIIVKSTAVKADNPEIIRASELDLPIIKRSEMLAELMRFKHSISISGTHGKTTTTSLVAKLFESVGYNPTVINGGIINTKGTNAYIGDSDYLIAEADESDGTFINVPSYVGVITNIDPEHLDYYETFENSIAAYRKFIKNLPFYGFGVLCYDHPIVRQLGQSIRERKVISYGIDSIDCDVRATNIETHVLGSKFDVVLSERYVRSRKLSFSEIKNIDLHLHGRHNILNTLSAISIGVEKGFSPEKIAEAFKSFGGVKRRFTKTGEVDGISIIDDYAHHPVEIKATLNTARQVADINNGKVIAVVQPHRYTRLRDLMDEFSLSFVDADNIFVTDVYAAGELPIPGITSEELSKRIDRNLKKNSVYLNDNEKLPDAINRLAKSGDLVVLLGAGNITKWAYELPNQIKKLRGS